MISTVNRYVGNSTREGCIITCVLIATDPPATTESTSMLSPTKESSQSCDVTSNRGVDSYSIHLPHPTTTASALETAPLKSQVGLTVELTMELTADLTRMTVME